MSRYEVTVFFEIDQPDDLALSVAEIADNVRMTALEALERIGFATVDPASVTAEVAAAPSADTARPAPAACPRCHHDAHAGACNAQIGTGYEGHVGCRCPERGAAPSANTTEDTL